MTEFRIRPLNRDSAICEPPLILRQNDNMRLIFSPTLVNNKVDESQPITGEFLYQKKAKRDEWVDLAEDRISSIEMGKGVKLALRPSEVAEVFQMLQALHAFFGKHGVPGVSRKLDLSQCMQAVSLPSDIAGLIQQAVEQSGVDGVASILQWAIRTGSSKKAVEMLQKLDIDNLQQISAISGISGLKKFLALWDAEQANSKRDEDFWQNELMNHPFVLSQVFSAPVVIIKDKAFIGGKGIEDKGGKSVDYMLQNIITRHVLIVEIKKPTTPLLGGVYRRPDIFNVSKELSGAAMQAIRYKEKFLKAYYGTKVESRTEFESSNPPCMVIIGNTSELDDKWKVESFECFRNNLRDVQVVTYDELVGKTGTLVNLLEGAFDTPKANAET